MPVEPESSRAGAVPDVDANWGPGVPVCLCVCVCVRPARSQIGFAQIEWDTSISH